MDTIGNEIRLSFLIAGNTSYAARTQDNDYWEKKCRALFLRPAVEPIILSYWERLVELDLDAKKAQKIVSALTVKEQVFRSAEGMGRSINGNVGFEPIGRARGWIDRLRAARLRPELASLMPMYTFASTIMAHPFADGNGRLARAMTLGALAKFAGWQMPIVPLAPSFYRYAEVLGRSLDGLTRSGDWTTYVTVFLDILDDAKELVWLLQQGDGKIRHCA